MIRKQDNKGSKKRLIEIKMYCAIISKHVHIVCALKIIFVDDLFLLLFRYIVVFVICNKTTNLWLQDLLPPVGGQTKPTRRKHPFTAHPSTTEETKGDLYPSTRILCPFEKKKGLASFFYKKKKKNQ